ncbi:chloride channel protein [Cupriavidus sp. 30B13]|uniref:chloride channel protein n=1 Tax=Cupriavidus sp. 30B13 TaxID=3384241 RepID=UPI003B8ECF65
MPPPTEGRGMARAAALLRWPLALLATGVAGGLVGLGVATLLHLIQHLAYGYGALASESFLEGVTQSSALRRVAALCACGVVAGAGWWAVYRWCQPLRSIARAVQVEAWMPPLATTCHALLQVVTVALGSPLGREVAPRELAAMLAGVLARRLGLPAADARILVACGAGAGLAAVYNVPLAGAVFVLEALLATAGWRALLAALSTSCIAALVARAGLGNHPQYLVPHYPVTPALLAWAALAGPLLGALGTVFTRWTSAARKHAATGYWLPLLCVLNFAVIGLVATHVPALLGNGKGPALVGFDGAFGVQAALWLLGLRALFTLTSLRAGAQGGLLTPALAIGALLASVLGEAWSLAWPGTAPGAFALVGAAAFLGSTMRAPLTAAVLIVEFTRPDGAFLLPVALGVCGAWLGAACVRRVQAARA